MKKKIAEYERQQAEGAESAPITKEENDRFNETFLVGLTQQPSGNRVSPEGYEKPITKRIQKTCRIL